MSFILFGAVQIILFVILEVHLIDDAEGESDVNVEGDAINLNKEDELERCTSASKRRHKRSKRGEQEQNEKPVKGKKCKQVKGCHCNQFWVNLVILHAWFNECSTSHCTALWFVFTTLYLFIIVVCNHEESVVEHEQSSIMDEDVSATKKKRKQAKNIDLYGDEPAKKKTKKKKAPKKSTLFPLCSESS